MRKIDYTSFNNGADNNEQVFNKRWWTLDGQELAQSVAFIVKMMEESDSNRLTQTQRSKNLYGNVNLIGSSALTQTKAASTQRGVKDRVTFNLVQSVVDTVNAKMIKNKPKPDFQTNGGDYKIQRKAKKLNQFIDGIFYEQKAYIKGPYALRNAEIDGDGLIQVFEEHGRVKWQIVPSYQCFVDMVDGLDHHPRQFHRKLDVDREQFAEMFPDKRKVIMEANSAKTEIGGNKIVVSDRITVCESWHLPSGPDANDGVHCINISGENIMKEKWDKPRFPFAKIPWCQRQDGYWSQGIPEQIQSIQLEANKLSWVIQKSMQLMGSFKVWLKIGSKMPKEQISNDIGAIWESEEMPQYITPPIVAPEVYERLSQLKEDAFEQVGISQLSASSAKPAGLNSGKALREFNDIESDRFTQIGQAYEDFFMTLACLSIDVVRDIFEREGTYEIKMPGKKFLTTIDWKDIDLKEDEYVMKMFPVSSLPNEPAGRLQTIQEYIQAGFISPRMGRRLLDFPDLDQIENLQDAQEDYLHKILGEIIDGDGTDSTYTAPEPDDDLQLAKELVMEYLAQAKTNGLEPEKIQLLRMFNDQIDMLNQKAQAAQMQQQMAQQQAMQPQAQPQPTPQSDLINNTAQGAA